MDHTNIKLILSPGNSKKLKVIEDSFDVHIVKNMQKGFMTIYGSENQVNKVITEINR